jgi:hypothetical protein
MHFSSCSLLVIARPLCAIPFPYCTQLFHCLSTDRRPAPFLCSALRRLSIALLFPASLRHSVALLFSSIPCHRSTVQCRRISSHFRAIPLFATPFQCKTHQLCAKLLPH